MKPPQRTDRPDQPAAILAALPGCWNAAAKSPHQEPFEAAASRCRPVRCVIGDPVAPNARVERGRKCCIGIGHESATCTIHASWCTTRLRCVDEFRFCSGLPSYPVTGTRKAKCVQSRQATEVKHLASGSVPSQSPDRGIWLMSVNQQSPRMDTFLRRIDGRHASRRGCPAGRRSQAAYIRRILKGSPIPPSSDMLLRRSC